MGWLNDLLTSLSDTDRTSIYLLIEDVEQMSCSLKWTTVDGFVKLHNHLDIWEKGNPLSSSEKGSYFDLKA